MAKKPPKPVPTNDTTPVDLAAELAAIFPDLVLIGRDAGRKRLFLHTLMTTGKIEVAAKAAGVARTTAWVWRQDQAFYTACERCKELAAETIEQALWTRAVDGVERGVYFQGQRIATEREYDTTSGIFLLKSLQPWRYRERRELTHELSPAMQAIASQWQLAREEASQRPQARLPAYEEEPDAIDGAIEPLPQGPPPLQFRPPGPSTRPPGPSSRQDLYSMLDKMNQPRADWRTDDEEDD